MDTDLHHHERKPAVRGLPSAVIMDTDLHHHERKPAVRGLPSAVIFVGALSLLLLGLAGCARPAASRSQVLRLATTTSTHDSGLLAAILPDFEERHQARVNVIALGTGQAMALGEAGDADVLLVHARAREDAFVGAGHGLARHDVMFNDYVLVGPVADPAGIRGTATAVAALQAIAAGEAPFASRGDDSGTHLMERSLWQQSGVTPDPALAWYYSLGQGMGDTLMFSQETGAYTFTDRGTFLFMRDRLPGLGLMVGGETIAENQDPALRNPYGVIVVNPDKGNINAGLGRQFVAWLTSAPVQEMIGDYGRDRFGQPLFYPAAHGD
jgi:tungstate transport system substrate-binding protein